MRFPTNTTLTTGEDSDSLTFRIERKRGWFERAVGVVMVCICFWEARQWQSLTWLVFGLIVVGGMVADWLRGAVTELTVTSTQMVARRNVGRMFSSEIH
jgi:hypothetical protein